MDSKKQISEDLKRFNSIIGYDVSGKNMINEAPGDEEFDFEAEETEGEETEGGAEGEEGADNPDFDFGGEDIEGDTEEVDVEGGEEPVEDEFGTAGEFSAVDDLEAAGDEDVEEIDVTDIVTKSEEAVDKSQEAVSIGQENSEYLKALTDKLTNLEAQLVKMDTIASKIGKLENEVKTPEEKLELRSLDSYPFNMKLSDYWNEKAEQDDNYKITSGVSVEDGKKKEYVLDKEVVDSDYNELEVKNSFNPELDDNTQY